MKVLWYFDFEEKCKALCGDLGTVNYPSFSANGKISPPQAAVPRWYRRTIQYDEMTVRLEIKVARSEGAVKYLI